MNRLSLNHGVGMLCSLIKKLFDQNLMNLNLMLKATK